MPPILQMNQLAPRFEGKAIEYKLEKNINLEMYKDFFIVFFFYPENFTKLSASELLEFSDRKLEFDKINAVVIGVSPDSHFSHLAWINMPRENNGLQGLEISLLSDKSLTISKDYGVLNEDTGVPYRSLFIIDPHQKLRQIIINDIPVCRRVDEVLRLVQAIQHYDRSGEVCPVDWKPGQNAIIPVNGPF